MKGNMKTVAKIIALGLVGAMTVSLLTGCAKTENKTGGAASAQKSEAQSSTSSEAQSSAPAEAKQESNFDASKEINVTSREDGSGTRGAFIELFGIEQKNDAGEKIDHTTEKAVITNSTAVMMQTVAGDLYSIGYISMGSLDNSVKAVKIDGAEATVANVESGSYKIARPFNIVTKDGISEAAQDFINYIMSADGQAVITGKGYIAVSKNPAYSGKMDSGKIVVAGSSSVTPVMEKLKEAYLALNPNVTMEIQQSDSTTGVTNTIDGTCDIGMASRELKDSEKEKGVSSTVIAMDGIAVIVNNDNGTDNLTSEQVKEIFMGNAAVWSDVIGK